MPGNLFYGDDGEYTFDSIEHLIEDGDFIDDSNLSIDYICDNCGEIMLENGIDCEHCGHDNLGF